MTRDTVARIVFGLFLILPPCLTVGTARSQTEKTGPGPITDTTAGAHWHDAWANRGVSEMSVRLPVE